MTVQPWSRLPLGSLVETVAMGPFGSSIKKETYCLTGVPVINGKNLHGVRLSDDAGYEFISSDHADRLSRSNAHPGDVVVTHRGTLGQVSVITEDNRYRRYVVSQSQLLVRPDKSKLSSLFLAYYLHSASGRFDLLAFATQTGVPAIAQPSTSLKRLNICLPPLRDQHAIAEVLGALDDKIAANMRLSQTTDTYIRSQYEAAVKRPGATPEPLFNVFEVGFGEAFKGEKFSEPGIGRPLIRIRDLKTFSSQVWTTESRPREIVVSAGDVVVGMDAEFRATTWLGKPGMLNQRVCRVVSKDMGPAFVREALKEPLAVIENYKTGTTVIHLNKKDLEQAMILVPCPDALRFFEAVTEDLYQARVALASENASLGEVRDSLLPQLMSGKLQVKDAEKLVEAAV